MISLQTSSLNYCTGTYTCIYVCPHLIILLAGCGVLYVAPVRSLSLTEPYLRLIRTQESLRLQCSRWHGDTGEELGFKDVLIRIVRVSEAGTAVGDGDDGTTE